MVSYLQTNRAVQIRSPLGDDAIHFLKLSGQEGISELFQFEIHFRKPGETPLCFDEILGRELVLEIELGGSSARYLAGLVAELAQIGRDRNGYTYRLLLVPRLWTTSLARRCRLFQQQSVPEILHRVLAGIECRFDLTATYPEHNLCVQFDETDFAFASRLMEEEGIHYYFEHSSGGDQLVVADSSPNAPYLPIAKEVVYGESGSGDRKGHCVHQWTKVQRVTVGKSLLRDYCFERSSAPIDGAATIAAEVTIGSTTHHLTAGNALQRQDYYYPAAFAHRFDSVGPKGGDQSGKLAALDFDAQRVAQLRIEQKASEALCLHGESDSPHLTPGYRFTLRQHFSDDGDYVVTRVEHTLESPDFRSGGAESWQYRNSFDALPAALPYRPPLRTPRARMRGSQTALVLGIGDDPIRTDKYGRVKVRFHWDREHSSENESSAWIRVGQNWAGSGWGMVNIPRANQEVVVDFLDGDPDCPIIVGSVYNSENMPPFELPENKTLAGIKTDSQLSKDSSSFSGLAFNDKDGHEEVHLRAQKDMVLFVKNNQLATVNGQNFDHTAGVRFTSVGGFPPRSGSGSGGGEGFVGTIREIVGWGWDAMRSGLGQSFATNIGVEARKGVGKCSTSVYGGATKTIVDPIAWSDEFAIPVHANLTYVPALTIGAGNTSLVYGTYVDRSFGARLRAQRGPLIEYAGSMLSDKFPTRRITGAQPMPTMVALVTEEILKATKKNNVNALVALNTGAIAIEGILGACGNYAERVSIRNLESALKINDGSEKALTALEEMPTVFSNDTDGAIGLIKAKNSDEAALDLVFQSKTSEQRSAHRVLVDGPYSVKSSGMLELTTFDQGEAGGARLNLNKDTSVLTAQKLVALMGESALVEISDGINAYGGAEGTVRIGAGQTTNKLEAYTQALFTSQDLTLSASANGINPSKIVIADSSIKIQIGAPNSCSLSMDGQSITLGCGRNSITINGEGIQLTGNLIKLNGQSGIQHTTPLLKVEN